MNSVERVKTICKERKIPISKLEKDLGYANGYIGQLRKGVFPDDRLADIAKYLSVSVEYLMTGNEKEKNDNPQPITAAELKFALFGDSENIDDEDLEDVRKYAEFVKERKRAQQK